MIIQKIALSKTFQNLIKKTENKNFYKKLNNTLPLLESSFATACYAISIHTNKKIEKERKPAMQWQNGICGVFGLLASGFINKGINNYKEAIIKELSIKNIDKVNNVIKGVQIALPLAITSICMRYLVPVISVPISTYLTKNKKKDLTNK